MIEIKTQELKEAYLTGKLSEFLDDLMIKNNLSVEDVNNIKNELDKIKNESKSVLDLITDVFKEEIISSSTQEYLTKEEIQEVIKAVNITNKIKKRIDLYLTKGFDEKGERIVGENSIPLKWELSKDDCADLALAIINNLEALYLYSSHWERKFDNDRKIYMEKYHLQRKTAEEFAKCDKNYIEFDKINIKVKVLKEKMLILKKKAGINDL